MIVKSRPADYDGPPTSVFRSLTWITCWANRDLKLPLRPSWRILSHPVPYDEYGYRVHGEYYSGHFSRQYADEQIAWSFVDSLDGKSVMLRFKDNNAECSVLREADQDPSWSEYLFPAVLGQVSQHWRDELRSDLVDEDENVEEIDDAEPHLTLHPDEEPWRTRL
jgi:hypothetical protein